MDVYDSTCQHLKRRAGGPDTAPTHLKMQQDEALRILSEHKVELREMFGVKSIAIFGSTARDEARPDSDVDTLIEIERPAGFFKIARVKFYLEDILETEVDLATPGALRSPIRERIYEDFIYV